MTSKGSALERLAVILICFGYLIVVSALSVVSGEREFEYNDAAVLGLVVFELCVGAAAIVFLRYRGWTTSDFGFKVSLGTSFAAIALLFGTNLICYVAYAALAPTGMFRGWTDLAVHSDATPALLLLFLIINSVFEELFVVGYLIEATPAGDTAFAVSTSALVRLLYHTYQGPLALAYILPFGVIFALVYLRWRNLWPLMLAHTMFNVMSWMAE